MINDSGQISTGLDFSELVQTNLCIDMADIITLSMTPLEKRKSYKHSYTNKCVGKNFEQIDHLILLFGSAARGEDAKDLDILVIVKSPVHWHRYQRLILKGVSFDFNIASSKWLENAYKDLEWGYCLSESYIIGCNASELEEKWRKSIRLYYSPNECRKRFKQHFEIFRQLSEAYKFASASNCQLIGRILANESIRSACCGLIEVFGGRVFSHRSFISEVLHSIHRANINPIFAEYIIKSLSGFSYNAIDKAKKKYVFIRTKISDVYRLLLAKHNYNYDPSFPKSKRIESLVEIANSSILNKIETDLLGNGANNWLPIESVINKGIQSILKIKLKIDDEFNKSKLKFHSTKWVIERKGERLKIPKKNSCHGARWVEFKNNELKIILSTGGCKTASCKFCYLPFYGSTQPEKRPSMTISELLKKYNPSSLKLYNDGSFFNPAEIEPAELKAIYREIKKYKIESLTIETIPRYINSQMIKVLIQESEVSTLTIAVGFQCLGDWIAVRILGRPDSDVIFERAIEILLENSIEIRSYLLWGFPIGISKSWADLLLASIKWLHYRGVQRITICPFFLPTKFKKQRYFPSQSLCSLRENLSTLNPSIKMKIDVSLPEFPSCGIEYMGEMCDSCILLLQTGQFQNISNKCKSGKIRILSL